MSEAMRWKLLLCALCALAPWSHASDHAADLVRKADELRQPLQQGRFIFKLTSLREDEVLKEATYEVLVKGRDRALVTAVKGKEKGQKILMLADGMWVRLPTSSRAIRITPMQKLMGEASYGDLGRLSWAEDYTAAFHPDGKEDNLDGVPTWRLRLTAKKSVVTYAQIDLWLNKHNGEPVQADFFLSGGKLLKRARFSPAQPLNNRQVLREVVFFDALSRHNRTVLYLEEMSPRDLADAFFSLQRFAE